VVNNSTIQSIVAIEMQNIQIQVRDKVLLKVDHLKFLPNDFVYIYGPNGSGKTTLLKFINCQLSPVYLITPIDANKPSFAKIIFKMNDGSPQELDLTKQSFANKDLLKAYDTKRIYFDGDDFGRMNLTTYFKSNWALFKDDILNKSITNLDFHQSLDSSQILTPIQNALSKQAQVQTFFQANLNFNQEEGGPHYSDYDALSTFLKVCFLFKKEFEKSRSFHSKSKSFQYTSEHLQALIRFVKRKLYVSQSAGQKQIIYLFKTFFTYQYLQLPLFSLDEPLNYLDSQNRSAVIHEIEHLLKSDIELGSMIFMVSHCTSFAFLSPPYAEYYGARKVRRILIDVKLANLAIEKKPGEPMKGCKRCDQR